MASKKYIDLKENDIVEFYLFPKLSSSNAEFKNNLDTANKTLEEICKMVKKISGNYIWHNEEFQICPRNLISQEHSDFKETEAFSFYGSLNYGENIEDEWFLVYILIELTKKIKDLVVRIKDIDGEFLLIEAAEYLPSWVTPETCEDRVFIYQGYLQILPKSFIIKKEFVTTEKIIDYVRKNSDQTRVGLEVQKAIERRIAGYPKKIDENFQNVNLYVPVAVAALLNAKPAFIAPAVRAFYERDLLDIKACKAMKFFPPENRVLSQIKFTKCLYAMLATSKYFPDKTTGWNLPHPNDNNYKSHLLGIKVACGFEILLSQIRKKPYSRNEDIETIDFNNDPNWEKFLKSLMLKNYFQGLLEHSKEYNRLLEAARQFYKNSCEHSFKPNKAKEISDFLDNLEIDMEDLQKKEKSLPPSDNDDWMNITQEDLNAMLEARFGRIGQTEENDVNNGNQDIANHLKNFINHISGLDGAEFPKIHKKGGKSREKEKRGVKTKKGKSVKFSSDTKLNSSTSEEEISNIKSDKIQFDPDGFVNAIQNILDFSIPDDNYWESDGSGMSSYEDESDLEIGETKLKESEKKDNDVVKYMQQMDQELYHTTMGKSFLNKASFDEMTEDSFEEVENFNPVNIDGNAFKNILSSYKAQYGNAGPAENLLGPLGVNLDDIDADVD